MTKIAGATLAYGLTVLLASSSAWSTPVPSYALQVAATHMPTPLDAGSPAFEPDGTACLRHGNTLTILRSDGRDEEMDFDSAAKHAINQSLFPMGLWDGSWDRSRAVDPSVVIDRHGVAYTIIVPRYSNLKTAVLLWSSDTCHTWHALALTGRSATLEHSDAFNDQSGPPAVLSFEIYGSQTGNHLWLDLFELVDSEVKQAKGSGALVADNSLLEGNHSGGGNSTFTTPDKILVVYPTTDRAAPGTQSVGRQFDRRAGSWSAPAAPIGRSTTKVTPDNHDIPAITMGPGGKAIVVIGAHHALLQMQIAKAADSITAGWSAPEIIGSPGLGAEYASYSYVSLTMSRQGTINIVARAEGYRWLFELVQFRKTANGSWNDWPGGRPHRIIAIPNRPAYGLWHQRVTADRAGRLYLSIAYVANQLTVEEANLLHVANARTFDCRSDRCFYTGVPDLEPRTLISDDDGMTWR
jgi:hypothetical protein